jgi:adenine phosphoribosyltransferase
MLKENVIKELIRNVPDFPSDGIMFRDITPVLQHADSFKQVISSLVEQVAEMKPDVIVGIESRGFIVGTPVALSLGVGFVPVRKAGKLPAETISTNYALEYGTDAMEMHRDAILPGQRVVIVDDLLATGGTAAAAIRLSEQLGGVVTGLVFLIELEALNGRKALDGYDVRTLVKY